jgi:hypothetical protein
VYGFFSFVNGQYLFFTVAFGLIIAGEYHSRLQLCDTMQHQHMSTNGFDSPPTPSKDMSKTIEPTNDISILVDGTTTVPNIEFSKCSSQAFR